MKIRHSHLLVMMVSVGQLVGLVVAVAWFVSWLQTSLIRDLREQVVMDNELAATQVAALIRQMDIGVPRDGSEDWKSLQLLVENTQLPNDGYLCIIERRSGALICHPKLSEDPGLGKTIPGHVILEGPNGGSRILDLGRSAGAGWANLFNSIHLIGVADVPELNIKVLALRKEEGIREVVQRVVAVVYMLGISTACVLVGFTILATIAIVRRYENQLAQTNSRLRLANNRMSRNLRAAAAVQKSLLPTVAPDVSNVRFEWDLKPCDELAGDLLNVFRLDDEYVGMYVLDVSGHGVSASLLSTTLNRALSPDSAASVLKRRQVNAADQVLPPSEVAQLLNEQFPTIQETMQYFTLLYGILSLSTRKFRFVSAGHPPPIFLSHDSKRPLLDSSGSPIGLVDEASYDEHVLDMQSGDRVYIYSDGILEARSRDGVPFGKDHLVSTLQRCHMKPLNESIDTLWDALNQWRGDQPYQDDMTILAMETA